MNSLNSLNMHKTNFKSLFLKVVLIYITILRKMLFLWSNYFIMSQFKTSRVYHDASHHYERRSNTYSIRKKSCERIAAVLYKFTTRLEQVNDSVYSILMGSPSSFYYSNRFCIMIYILKIAFLLWTNPSDSCKK